MAGSDLNGKQPSGDKNVVNLAEARKRQRTLHRAGASGRGDGQKKDQKGEVRGFKKVLLYGQLLLFLAIIAYFMQLCSH